MQRFSLPFQSSTKQLPKRSRPHKKQAHLTTLHDEHDKDEHQLKVEVKVRGSTKKIVILCNPSEPLASVRKAIFNKLQTLKVDEGVVGFAKEDVDFAFDYKFHLGIGNLHRNIVLKCLYDDKSTGLEKFQICCCLASGGFSKVFLVRSKVNANFYAAKFIEKTKIKPASIELIENEKNISSNLDSPFLVKTHEFIETPEYFVLIMDYCAGGELFFLLKNIKLMNQHDARICFIQVLLGIEVIHNAGYMYRDLKPQNILIDEHGFFKIADFGLAKSLGQRSYSFCGSVDYMAPEIITSSGHSQSVDFYCLGVLLYELLIGFPPFYSMSGSDEQTKISIVQDEIAFPELSISALAMDLIQRLMTKNEKRRLGYYGGCRQIMSHPWIGKIDRKMYEQRNMLAPFPTNLERLNFDPDEVGESERNFEHKINRTIALSKSKNKKERRLGESIQCIQKQSGIMECVDNLIKKRTSTPGRNKSLGMVYINEAKARCTYFLKRPKAKQNLKTEKSLDKQHKNRGSYTKFIDDSVEISKNVKIRQSESKLRKKHKYIAFLTSPNVNDIISKVKPKRSGQKLYQKELSSMLFNPTRICRA